MSAQPARWSLAFVPLMLFADPLAARDPFESIRHRMVEEVVASEGIKDPRVLESMRRTPRHEFVPLSLRKRSYYDMALPIGKAQTISPPYIVAFMTERLEPKPDDKVLEIGTGSGYQAAVLSPLVKDVYTIEIVETLGRRAASTLRRLKYENVHTRLGDGFKGWPEKAPFDKIIVTCSPEDIPKPLAEQLAEGGRMVIPLGERYQQSLYLLTKKDGKLVKEELAPTMFVPMTGQAEANRKIKPDPLNPELVNGGFEEFTEKTGKLTNWYYQRQITVESEGAPSGERFATFNNREAGRGAFALQAFPVDGRAIRTLTVSGWVKGASIRAGLTREEIASVVVTFFDDDRRSLSNHQIGNWRNTFDWQEFGTEIRVPATARAALLRIGLQGGTGQVSFDAVAVEVAKKR